MITLDLHLHSNFSDGVLKLEQLIDLYGRQGADVISVTDHLCTTDHLLGVSAHLLHKSLNKSTWKTYQAALRRETNRAWREYKMLVMAGVEFSRNTFSHERNAHLLAIDVKDYIPPNQSEEEWLKEARDQGALTVAAHPLKLSDAASQTYYLYNNRRRFAPLIDVWEVANAKVFWDKMLETPFSLLASSDLHHPKRWGSWRTRIPCDKDPEAIKNHLRNPFNPRDFVLSHDDSLKIKETRSMIRKEICA